MLTANAVTPPVLPVGRHRFADNGWDDSVHDGSDNSVCGGSDMLC
jgi:hypothetical protein